MTMTTDRDGVELYALTWWTFTTGELVGVVALLNRRHGYWKCYVGRASGNVNADADMAMIAACGVHAGEKVAHALIPDVLVRGLDFRAT